MTNTITINKCPSWKTVSGLLGEWNRYQHRNGFMSPYRAFEICGMLEAVHSAKRQGYAMPKDWGKVHPSQPYQMGELANKMRDDPIIRGANNPPTVWIQLRKTRDYVKMPSPFARTKSNYVLYENSNSVGNAPSEREAKRFVRCGL